MVQLDDLGDYIWMIAWAAFFGALGGMAAYIMAKRQAAATARPDGAAPALDRSIGWRVMDLATRGLGSIFLGSVAAVISLYFLAPITTTVVEGADGVSSIDRYNVIQLVALALVVGAAGETVIAAAQARIVAAVQAEKTQATAAVAQAKVDEVGQRAMASMERLASGSASDEITRGGGTPNGTSAAQSAAAQEELRQGIESAKATIRSVAG